MTVPSALTAKELLNLFKNRGMDISNADPEKLKHINYYKLKEFAHPLSKISKNSNGEITISYDGVSFHDILRRYYQDKNLRIYLLHAIEKIEISLKTTLSHEMGIKYGAFGYLNFFSWVRREKYSKFEIEDKQYRFKKDLLYSIKRNHYYEFDNAKNMDPDGFPTIWLAVDIITLGNIVTVFDMLNASLLRKIASEYNASPVEFLSWIKCLHFVRNLCAHNSNLIDIKLKTKPKYRKEWLEYLYLLPKGNSLYMPTNRLAGVICIALYMVKAINPKYHMRNIQGSIASLCNKSDAMANLIGFASYDAAKKITTLI